MYPRLTLKKDYRIRGLVDDLGGPTSRNESFQDVSTSSKLIYHDTLGAVHTFPWIVLILGSWKIWLWNSLLWKFFVDTFLLFFSVKKYKNTNKQERKDFANKATSKYIMGISDISLWQFPCGHFPRIWISRKRIKNSTFWLQFWRGFDASVLEQLPDLNYLDFCRF